MDNTDAASDYRHLQRQLADHLREPGRPAPEGVEARRLKIYQDLIYNNVEGFLGSGFPILKSLFSDDEWHQLVRDFMVEHSCHTPYFLEITQEFLRYLQEERAADCSRTDPPFILELAHYEWVELALDVDEAELQERDKSAVPFSDLSEADKLKQSMTLSPLAWPLSYQYPVHQIGPEFQPEAPSEQPTCLVVYRNRDDQVEFMAANVVTIRLLNLLSEPVQRSLAEVLSLLANELQRPCDEAFILNGLALVDMLESKDILLTGSSIHQ
jgi:uncharacterized protein